MLLQPLADSGYVSLAVLFVYREYQVVWSACLSICVPCASVLRAYMWRAKGSGMGFIIEYYLIVVNIASVNLKIIKPKYPVACSRSVGAAGERDLLWSMLLCVADQHVSCACVARLRL